MLKWLVEKIKNLFRRKSPQVTIHPRKPDEVKMDFKSPNNQWLRVEKNVVLTPKIDPCIFALDKHFQHFNMVRYVVAGYRLKQDQLQIIIDYCHRESMPNGYTSTDVDKKNEIGQYVWQYDWSRLLVKGYKINPPCECTVLLDYSRETNNGTTEIVKAGTLIAASNHFKGDCFDISGRRGLQDKEDAEKITDELEVLEYAMKNDNEIFQMVLGYVIERKNNCLHIRTKIT